MIDRKSLEPKEKPNKDGSVELDLAVEFGIKKLVPAEHLENPDNRDDVLILAKSQMKDALILEIFGDVIRDLDSLAQFISFAVDRPDLAEKGRGMIKDILMGIPAPGHELNVEQTDAGALVMPAKENEAAFRKNWTASCSNCEATPTVGDTGLCGPCCFGEAETIGGNW
jgi:hypothetical protein